MLMEMNIGPFTRLVAALEKSDPAKLASLRREFEELATRYFDDNHVRQDYLITRAVKR